MPLMSTNANSNYFEKIDVRWLFFLVKLVQT